MALSPPDDMNWLSRVEQFTRVADELESLVKSARSQPEVISGPSAVATRAALVSIEPPSLKGTTQSDFVRAKEDILGWLDGTDGAPPSIGEAVRKTCNALRETARSILGQRSEIELRLAWLYQLYVLRSTSPSSCLLESGMRTDFGVEYELIDSWINWAMRSGFVQRANEGPDRGFALTTTGAEYVESALRAGVTDGGATREKQQKFGILDAPNLLARDLEALSTKPSLFGTAVLFFDLDHFKALNTELTEREVDRSVLPVIQATIRDAAAYQGHAYAEGGDEFVVLLPNANASMALAFAEGLRRSIEELVLSTARGDRRITASFGVASTEHWNIGELADRANDAKVEAKKLGRNRVVSAAPAPTLKASE